MIHGRILSTSQRCDASACGIHADQLVNLVHVPRVDEGIGGLIENIGAAYFKLRNPRRIFSCRQGGRRWLHDALSTNPIPHLSVCFPPLHKCCEIRPDRGEPKAPGLRVGPTLDPRKSGRYRSAPGRRRPGCADRLLGRSRCRPR